MEKKASQWFHVETYGKTSGKKGKERWTSGKVLDEAFRVEGAHPHVKNPREPEILMGSREAVEQAITALDGIKDSRGRKRRADSRDLLAGVASFPIPVKRMEQGDPEDLRHFERWLKLCTDYLERKYKNQLKAVVFHQDEGFPHIHFYVVPETGRMADIHMGQAASDTAKTQGKRAESAYVEGMRNWQDEYFQEVGFHCGFTRLSDCPRERKDRGRYLAEKSAAGLAADCLERQIAEISEKTKALDLSKEELAKRRGTYAAAMRKVIEQEQEREVLKQQHAEELRVLTEKHEAERAVLVSERDAAEGVLTGIGLANAHHRKATIKKEKEAVKTPSKGFDFGL